VNRAASIAFDAFVAFLMLEALFIIVETLT
jgi:hypothetical protein